MTGVLPKCPPNLDPDGEVCDAMPPAGLGYYCSREDGHKGMHVANAGDAVALWDESIVYTRTIFKEWELHVLKEKVVTETYWEKA